MKIALVYAEYENMTDEIRQVNPNADNIMENMLSSIKEALESKNHEVFEIPANIDMMRNIMEIEDLDVIFIHYDPLENLKLQGNVFAALELLGIPIVGSGMLAQATALSKETANLILASHGLPIVKSQILFSKDDELKEELKESFPLFVKPESEAVSVGIRNDSYVENEEELENTLDRIFSEVNPPIIIEEFLPGREFTVGVLEDMGELKALEVTEITFNPESGVSFRTKDVVKNKWTIKTTPAKIDEELELEMKYLAIKSFKAMNCDTYARIDIRLNADGEPYIMEINTMPGLSKTTSPYVLEAKASGIEYEELINKLVRSAYHKGADSKKLGIGKF